MVAHWVSRAFSALTLTVLLSVGSFFPTSALAQQRDVLSRAEAVDVESLLEHGRRLETEQRWGEALTHYEDALRRHPASARLEQRFLLSRLHFDVTRRYHDESFRTAVRTLGEQEALALYSEVLLKVQSHYVEQPSWNHLVDRGTTSLDVALSEPAFLAENELEHLSTSEIARFRRDLRSRLATIQIVDRHSARDAAATAARLAWQSLRLSPIAVVLEYTSGATHGLDDYSAYLTADQLNDVYSQIDGNFVGLGIELKTNDGQLRIVNVIGGSPAAKAGIHAGQVILRVDGQNTSDVSTDAAADLLQGPEGSVVRLVVAAPGEQPREIRVRREHVEVPSIEDAEIVDPDRGIAYLRLTSFQKTTSRDLDNALWSLHRQGMRSLIIDVRGNPGGLLSASVDVADKFIEGGSIVSTRGRNPHEDFDYRAHRAGTWRVPLVVLIDGDSASASEIFAGAIRDHRRGVLVGSRSYGKGSVQGIFPLNVAHFGLRLTTAKFYSPIGRPFSKVGVQPNVTVNDRYTVARPVSNAAGSLADDSADAALEAAIQQARLQLARR